MCHLINGRSTFRLNVRPFGGSWLDEINKIFTYERSVEAVRRRSKNRIEI